MKTKLDPQIYEKAAARILKGENLYCCCAIDDVRDSMEEWDLNEHREAFRRVFSPTEDLEPFVFWTLSDPNSQEARVIALLLMAEIAKDW